MKLRPNLSNQDLLVPYIKCNFENTNTQLKWHWIMDEINKLASTVKKTLNSIKEGVEAFDKTRESTIK